MAEFTISTLADLPFHVSGRFPKPVLVRRCTADAYDSYASREFFDAVRDASLGLATLGVKPGDRVALLSESRPEWLIADLAILTSGSVTVPIYPTLPPAQVGYILADAGAAVVLVSDETQAEKVRSVWSELAELRMMIVVDALDDVSRDEREMTFAGVRQQGHRRLMRENGLGREYKEAAGAIGAEQLATIIYTSGTTGDPKGVMLTHGAIVANLLDIDTMTRVTEEDDALSFLPLSHALERTVIYLYLFKGVTITFAESLETVEQKLKRHPLVAEAMVVGDRQPFVAVLIIPDFSALAATLDESTDAGRDVLVRREDVRQLFEAVVEGVNTELASYEQMRKVALVPAELSVATGELTPTLKVKRRVVAEQWRGLIDELYGA